MRRLTNHRTPPHAHRAPYSWSASSSGAHALCSTAARSLPDAGRAATVLITLLVFTALAAGGLVYSGLWRTAMNFIEQQPPVLEIEVPNAFGVGATPLTLLARDEGGGLYEVQVYAEQSGKRIDILKKQLHGSNEEQISFDFNPRELGIREDAFTLHVVAFDRTMWSNRAESTHATRALYARPRVETLTVQHNVAQGGAGMVFYRILAGQVSESGIRIGEREFPGYPAALLGAPFDREPNVRFALFAVPKFHDSDRDRFEVFVRDIAGNSATAAVNHRILKRRFREAAMSAPPAFLRRKLPELLPAYYEMKNEQDPLLDVERAEIDELVKNFRLVNEDLRAMLDRKLAELSAKSAPKRMWEGAFQRPMPGASTSAFGEQRRYSVDGRPAGGSTHDGVDLAATANAPVTAAQAGTVLFTGELGIYGRTVVIDHGFGLTTLYGHLSSIAVQDGDAVTTSTVLGRSGTTGLAGGDHLHYEVRVHNYPVTPIEWWDPAWVRDHIDGKIRSMANYFGE